jgi:hypothetical protein
MEQSTSPTSASERLSGALLPETEDANCPVWGLCRLGQTKEILSGSEGRDSTAPSTPVHTADCLDQNSLVELLVFGPGPCTC